MQIPTKPNPLTHSGVAQKPSADGFLEPVHLQVQVQAIVDFFENLTPASAAQCGHFYDPHARFKDPFNDVTGLENVVGIYEHMYEALHEPRFVVTGRIVQNGQCVLLWDFLFRFKRFNTQTVQTVHGSSHLVLGGDGKIVLHRDYWDVAEELYEKLPVVGALMRWLKKRANS